MVFSNLSGRRKPWYRSMAFSNFASRISSLWGVFFHGYFGLLELGFADLP